MPRRTVDDDDWDDDDPDGDSGGFADDDDDDATIACPHCRRQIHEDAPQCPYCHEYISDEDAPPAIKPWWIILGVILALYAIYRGLIL